MLQGIIYYIVVCFFLLLANRKLMLAKTIIFTSTLQCEVCSVFNDSLSPPNKNFCEQKLFETMSLRNYKKNSQKLDFHFARHQSTASYNTVLYPLQFFFLLFLLKNKYKLTHLEVMSHLYPVVVSVRK